MRPALFIPLALVLSACADSRFELYNPFNGNPINLDPQGYAERRAMVELEVKDRFPEVLRDIETGAGPDLSRAMDAAAIPTEERPARILQLQGDLEIYRGNPDALITQLLLFGA